MPVLKDPWKLSFKEKTAPFFGTAANASAAIITAVIAVPAIAAVIRLIALPSWNVRCY